MAGVPRVNLPRGPSEWGPPQPNLQGVGGDLGTDPLLSMFRGSVAYSIASEADLERIAEGSRRRGNGPRPQPRREIAEEDLLQALCEWLSTEHHLNLMGVVTYSDRYADRHKVYSLDRALDDVWLALRSVPIGGRQGYPWKFILSAELHRSGRQVPHVHVALECPDRIAESVCADLWDYFYSTRGRSRFEPMRDRSAATLYGLKDTVKVAKVDTAATRVRLWHPKRRSSRRSPSGGGGDPPRS